jgi:hypothetical protein
MPSMPPTIRSVDMSLIDALFGMGGGYVLDFSDRTYSTFFSELGIDIDHPRFSVDGSSKAKRLRYFLRSSQPAVAVKVLTALWEYREIQRRLKRQQESLPDAEREFWELIGRLGGRRPGSAKADSADGKATRIDVQVAHALRDKLISITRLAPQPRGYAYEKFWQELFDANGLQARSSFRLTGEQIDGSFVLDGETYLLEAKWRGLRTTGTDLHAFQGKLEQKAHWTRGLFVSDSGFSEDGLTAFGGGKRIVCMDGLDLHDMLDRGISFHDVMTRKVRRAAESGLAFVRVRDLFP